MKKTVVVDELGRVLIPRELRQELGIKEKDILRPKIENGNIVLTKVENE